MSTRLPKITALLIVRNRQDLLPLSVASVQCQDYPEFELLIVDDESTDDTRRVAEALAMSDVRIRVIPNSRGPGIPRARNTGLSEATGEFLAICDSDDLSRPERFRRQAEELGADPRLVGVGSRINTFTDDPSAGQVPDWRWGLRDGRGPFPFPTAMLRTQAVRDCGGFDEDFAIVEDLELCYRLAGRGWEFGILNDVLVDYRVGGQGVTAANPALYRYAFRAQVKGIRALRGRFTPLGYLIVIQSGWRAVRDSYRSRFSKATAR